AVLRAGGQARPSRVYKEVRHLVRPIDAEEMTAQYTGTPTFDDACLRLLTYGLMFTGNAYQLFTQRFKQRIYIPAPILNLLNTDPRCKEALARKFPPAPLPGTPELISTSSAEDFQRDLSRYLRHARKQNSVALTTQEWIYKTNFKSFLAALNVTPEPPGDEESNPRLWFMRRMLTVMGELTMNNAGFSAGEKSHLLSIPIAERVKQAFEVWINTGVWDELNRVPYPHNGYSRHAPAAAGVCRAHSALLRGILKLVGGGAGLSGLPAPVGRWITLEQLVDQMWRNDYDFLIKRPKESRQTQYDDPYGNEYTFIDMERTLYFENIPNEAQGWDVVEREFIVNVIKEPLYWMGLLELGYSKDTPATPIAFRLTPAGAWLMGAGKQPEFIESGGRVLVQPNFTVLAMEPISDAVLLALDDFAQSQGGDRAITYHLTRQSVYHGQKKGWTEQKIGAFLAQHQGGPIPLNVQRTLEEWQALYERITFHRSATVLHYADEAARDSARQVLASVDVPLRALATTIDIVLPDEEKPYRFEQIGTTLSNAGWMPLLTSSAETQQASGSLHIDEAGEIVFKHSVPNIYALNRLDPFVERADGHTRITAQKVREQLSKGKTADELLATLASLNDGPLPAGLETRVREWAIYFGDATLANVCLLELSTHQVLEHLLEDDEVGGFLREVKGSLVPLAVVQADKLDQVRAALSERGL
ncbi:MAG TPA: helicase-associated domain-containing protein, partial [Anaerolineae bacterium]